MHETFRPLPRGQSRLLPGLFAQRAALNRKYMMSLSNENLLQNFYLEAGLWSARQRLQDIHWGWESPTCQVRGHFLGHWLSAAARYYAATGDMEVKAKADRIVSELARCQQENGGEWAGSIPEKYLDWVARGKGVWAPHYTLHKTLMGLVEMASLAGNAQALEVLGHWGKWFHRWSAPFSRQQMDDILDVETGGMLEAWADLYGLTQNEMYIDLLRRYDRPRLFERLLAGDDPLTNMHANTTIPEIQGAARAWEVTGEERYRQIVEAYWAQAVSEHGYYCTGGQTDGEIWTPPQEQSARLGDKNQEHCVVYNLMRLAEYLLRWSGEVSYADYWERNLYNGILAQQHPVTGMIAYFLPLHAGARKVWGSPTEDFWCCHGSLVQAHADHTRGVYYEDDEGLVICQYIPSEAAWTRSGDRVMVRQTRPDLAMNVNQLRDMDKRGETRRPDHWTVDLTISSAQPTEFALKLRAPWWLNGVLRVELNGAPVELAVDSGYAIIRRAWREDHLRIALPKGLWNCQLPDEPETVAFMDGPVVLAGLCDHEMALRGDATRPETLLAPDNEREWGNWRPGYRAVGQERGLRFAPLYEITDERYTVYFPIKKP
jgi:hypothetical protein